MSWKKLLVRVSIPVLGGMASGYIANKMNEKRSTKEQYKSLDLPSASPPASVFPVVWTSLYTTMGIAHHIVKESNLETNTESNSFYVQLGVNMLWSYLFFGLGLRGLALIESFLLLLAVLYTTYRFFMTSSKAGNLMLPYVAWTAFAVYLNAGTWYLNKG